MTSTHLLRTIEIVVDGVRSPVIVGGPHETAATDTEAVVFVHGNPDTGSDWMPLLSEVAQFARVIAPDMPGFGRAEMRPDQPYTVPGYATHLAGVVDHLGAHRVHLVAHDFGGPWALTWAAAHLQQVASVTLINTGVLMNYHWHRAARLWRRPVIGELAMRLSMPAVMRAWLRHDNPGLPQHWVDEIVRHATPRGTKHAVLKLYRSTTEASIEALSPILRAADLPALVVWGANDVYVPVTQAAQQRRTFPKARTVILPGVGHWAWLEAPDQVRREVLPFLREQLRRSQAVAAEAPLASPNGPARRKAAPARPAAVG